MMKLLPIAALLCFPFLLSSQVIGGNAVLGGAAQMGVTSSVSAPTYGTSARGGDAFACYSTLTCTTGNITATSGQPIVVVIVEQNASSITGITDTCNTGGTTDSYTSQQTSQQSTSYLELYTTTAGASRTCTVTATYVGATTYSRIFAVPVTGAAVVSPFGNSNSNTQLYPGTGTNAITTGNFSTTSANNLVIATICDVQGATGTFTAGTSPVAFTLDFSNYDGGNYTCAMEYGAIASASSVTPTLTEGTGGGSAVTVSAGIAIIP